MKKSESVLQSDENEQDTTQVAADRPALHYQAYQTKQLVTDRAGVRNPEPGTLSDSELKRLIIERFDWVTKTGDFKGSSVSRLNNLSEMIKADIRKT